MLSVLLRWPFASRPGTAQWVTRGALIVASALLVSACQHGVRSDLQNQTIGELIDNSGLRPEQMGISVERTATAPTGVAQDSAQSALKRSTADAIDHYDKVVAVEADRAVRAESLRRSADLRVEQAQVDGSGDYAAELDAAIDAYQRLLGDYQDYTNRAQVYYQLARAHELSGNSALTIQFLLAAADAPHSGDLADEAQFRAAELLTHEKRFQRAAEVYSAVLVNEGSEYRDLAYYKRGWSYYQLGDYRAALEDMGTLLANLVSAGASSQALPGLADLDRTSSPLQLVAGEQREMARDAMRLSVLSVAAETSLAFKSVFTAPRAAPFRDQLYRQLGAYLVEKERYTDAASIYRGLVSSKGPSADTAVYMVKAVESLELGGFASQAIAAREDFISLFEPVAVNGAEADESGAAEVARTWVRYCLDVAAWRHKEAAETPEAEPQQRNKRYRVAADWHLRLLQNFPNHEEAAQSTVLYADALFNAGEVSLAAESYARAAYQYPEFDGAADAALASVKSYRALLDQTHGAVSEQQVTNFVEASQRFVSHFKDHAEASAVEVDSLNVLFEQRHYQQLIAIAEPLLDRAGLSQEQRADALAMLAESNLSLQRYAAAEQAFDRLMKLDRIATTERGGRVRERLAYTVYRHAEMLRASKDSNDNALAADKLMHVVSLSRDASLRESALYDAALLRYQLKQWQASAGLLKQFITRYPDSALIADIRSLLASAYEEAGHYTAAAETYRRIAVQSDIERDVRYRASLKAADLYRRDNDTGSMLMAYEQHLKLFPQPVDDAQRIRWQLAEAFRQGPTKNEQRYRDYLKGIVDVDNAQADLPDEVRLLAARATLALARFDIARAGRIALRQPLKESLARRRKVMDTAISGLQRATDYQFASVTTAASHDLGMLYLDFARALLRSDRPEGLSAEVLEEYSLLLEEQAYPFEEKAISVFEENLSRLFKGLWNTEMRKSLAVLSQLDPARYRKRPKLEGVYDALR